MKGNPGPKRKPYETRELVRKLLSRGLLYAEVARRLDIGKPTVAYHAKRLGRPIDERAARRYDWAEIQRAYDEGLSVRGCMEKFGFSSYSWHKAVARGAVKARPAAMPIESLLVNGRRTSRTHLKLRLIRAGLKENRCEQCGISEWCGRPLTMALHHVNGQGRDNRLTNIQFLCPNCHAQTDNYSGKGIKRKQC